MVNFQFGTSGSDALLGTDESDALFGRGGDDQINGLAGDDILSGGGGNDTIVGGLGLDTLDGDRGADILIGDRGDDIVRGGDGADLLIWNNGDGSDLMDGGGGFDRLQVNGALEAGDEFVIEKGGADSLFDRVNLGLFQLNVNNVERLEVNGGGGDDRFTVGDLLGAKLQDVRFFGGLGEDTFDATAATTSVRGFGGEGNDLLLGSSVSDVLRGDAGDDTIVGNRGDDDIAGGAGNDRMIWNNGDGSDLMRGGAGLDVVEVNGADGPGDSFTLAANGDRVDFARTNLGLFELDIDGTETMEINGQGGDDRLQIGSLSETDLRKVTFDGGDGNDILDAGSADVEIVAIGGLGDDLLITGRGNDTVITGIGADSVFTGAGRDRIDIDGFDGVQIADFSIGNDVIDIASLLEAAPADGDFDGFVQLIDDGESTTVQVDRDGGGDSFVSIAVLDGVTGTSVDQLIAETPII